MTCQIQTDANRVFIAGTLALSDLRRLTATLHNLTSKQGYMDIHVDFERCTGADPSPMLALAAQAASLRADGVDVTLRLPEDARLSRIFSGANWAHLIDPEHYKQSSYRGYTHVPAVRYVTDADQQKIVNRMIDAMLCAIPGIERSDLAAIEWSLNEVSDNVLVHSSSKVGGLAQLNNYRVKKSVEFSVVDAGCGIPDTLRARFAQLDDVELLEQAVKEGVTRDPSLGQGNGLFGTYQVARVSNGSLYIASGYATLSLNRGQLRITREKIPYSGTLVVARLDCASSAALSDVLRFGDNRYSLTDYIDLHFVNNDTEDVVFRLHEETLSCGSRVAGTPVRTKLANLVGMNRGRRIIVDLSEIVLVSSSFADEVFGRVCPRSS